MAAHANDENLPAAAEEQRNPYASSNRWRHQESSAFARHAAAAGPRDAEARGRVDDLASFLNTSRVPPEETAADGDGGGPGKFKPIMIGSAEAGGGEQTAERPLDGTAAAAEIDHTEIACGPLLNYRRTERGRWIGSVLVVTRGGGKTEDFVPTLLLRRGGAIDARQAASEPDPGASSAPNGANGVGATHDAGSGAGGEARVKAFRLYSDPRNTFWRFDLSCAIEATESRWEYELPDLHFVSKTKPQRNFFYVPAETESMRIMFHSCNGFSVGTDEDAWSGPALWNDVLRRHKEAPFHVMVGGGDQIYNDGIRVSGPLRTWTAIGNPKKRKEYPYPESMRQECDDYYLQNYVRWYDTEPFATANGQIPQLNIWDDHDIIDGFGSYVNDFMKCDVFRGIGGTAHKYYMLFQHHLPPPKSTYTTDRAALESFEGEQGEDPNQLMDTFVADPIQESNYIVGPKPGPYVAEHSYNMFCRLGARIALLGIDARTERTRHQVNYPETYQAIFERLRAELSAAKSSGQPISHLIFLLGIPIAYPRLTWLENIFSSPLMGPVKFLNRRFGLGGGIFNHFDGSVDLLDDLDDHYTARTHKKERNTMIETLQTICSEFSTRITILGGDVHLAALGRFYSNPKLNIPTENDWRYMVNVVSSAIVNKPPPQAVANLLARRNKIHHLNHETDETLLSLFNKDPGDSTKTASHNKVTMPSRNFAIITENSPHNPASNPFPAANGDSAPATGSDNDNGQDGANGTHTAAATQTDFSGKDGHAFLHAGEVGAGTEHKAASKQHGRGNDGSLDICIRVEVSQHDGEGKTEGYGLTVPRLVCKPQSTAGPPPLSMPEQADFTEQ